MPEKMSGFSEQYLYTSASKTSKNWVCVSSHSSPRALQPQGNPGWNRSLDCPQPKTGPAPRSDMLLALSCVIFKPSEDGDCTVWALWGPWLNCLLENRLHLISRYQDAGCRAPMYPEDYSGSAAKFRSWFFTYHLTVFIMLCYSQNFTVICLL